MTLRFRIPQFVRFIDNDGIKQGFQHFVITDELRQEIEPVFESFERAKREGIFKDFPIAVISTLTIDVASSLAQKEAAGIVELTDEDVDRVMNIVLDAIMT